ncbi:MAG: transporter related protein [Frankiales bacterium]|nr:transporter related protein [Frankiales bacterium]
MTAPTMHPGTRRPDLENAVEVTDLHKKFGDFEVLKGLDMNFKNGAITTVLGPSGTGKSVLLKHMVALLEPDRGDVVFYGEKVSGMTQAEKLQMRQRYGVLFQDGALFGSMNIYDNVAFPLRKHTDKSEEEIRDLIIRRLTEVGLDRSLTKFPNEVSGGMRKRAGFARALVLNPDVVLFDEPDSGLDPVRTSLLNDLILDMHAEHGGTYLLVTHNIPTARKVSDYVGLVWQGRKIHYGPTEEAFDSEDPFVRQFLAGDSAGPLGMD